MSLRRGFIFEQLPIQPSQLRAAFRTAPAFAQVVPNLEDPVTAKAKIKTHEIVTEFK